jgi:hypothetical protein
LTTFVYNIDLREGQGSRGREGSIKARVYVKLKLKILNINCI